MYTHTQTHTHDDDKYKLLLLLVREAIYPYGAHTLILLRKIAVAFEHFHNIKWDQCVCRRDTIVYIKCGGDKYHITHTHTEVN